MQQPLILISNDDSVYAKGIRELVEMARPYGEVIVVAPDKHQSAKSHAVTLDQPLFVSPTKNFENIKAWKCSGTPADCVKIALHEILKDRKPDLVISGINHGSNASVNVLYSGTMAATIEGCLHGVPSIGFSLLNFDADADFTVVRTFGPRIIEQTLLHKLPRGICLNVNFPAIDVEKVKGIKICRQTIGVWAEEFAHRKHPRGTDYYWLTGKYLNLEPEATDTDIWALDNNYVAVVPIQVDLTAYSQLHKMNDWEL